MYVCTNQGRCYDSSLCARAVKKHAGRRKSWSRILTEIALMQVSSWGWVGCLYVRMYVWMDGWIDGCIVCVCVCVLGMVSIRMGMGQLETRGPGNEAVHLLFLGLIIDYRPGLGSEWATTERHPSINPNIPTSTHTSTTHTETYIFTSIYASISSIMTTYHC
jgi:hypothetical protein